MQAAVSVEERIADLKSQGKAAFGKKDYVAAMYFYGLVRPLTNLVLRHPGQSGRSQSGFIVLKHETKD